MVLFAVLALSQGTGITRWVSGPRGGDGHRMHRLCVGLSMVFQPWFPRGVVKEMLQFPKIVTPGQSFFFFFKGTPLFIYLFIYLFMAVLGLRFCARAFSSCGKWGPLFIAVRGPLTVAVSLVAEHRLQTCRLSSCGSWA